MYVDVVQRADSGKSTVDPHDWFMEDEGLVGGCCGIDPLTRTN
jgi:hypothetical protein